MRLNQNKAFTLIELLVVIGIIGLLAAIVVVAVNPNKQLAASRDVTRQSDVRTIANAVKQYEVEQGDLPQVQYFPGGSWFEAIPNSSGGGELCRIVEEFYTAFDCRYAELASSTGVYLGVLIPDYLDGIPVDPTHSGHELGTSYFIQRVDQRIRVSAPNAEGDDEIFFEL